MCWTNEGKYHWEEEEAVRHPERDDADPNSEEDNKDVLFSSCEYKNCKEGRKPSVEHACTHFAERKFRFVESDLVWCVKAEVCRDWCNEEWVSNVNRVFDWYSYGNDDVQYHKGVQGHLPEVDEAEKLEIRTKHAK